MVFISLLCVFFDQSVHLANEGSGKYDLGLRPPYAHLTLHLCPNRRMGLFGLVETHRHPEVGFELSKYRNIHSVDTQRRFEGFFERIQPRRQTAKGALAGTPRRARIIDLDSASVSVGSMNCYAERMPRR